MRHRDDDGHDMARHLPSSALDTSLAGLLQSEPKTLRYADLVLDVMTCRVTRGGRRVPLGPTEFRLLHLLMSHPERVFSRTALVAAIWGHGSTVELSTVNVHIRRLRVALNAQDAPDLIRTVRAAGYSLDAEAADGG